MCRHGADERVRAIGVSNFQIAHLQRLLDETQVVPAVNQVELHPGLQQKPLRRFHATHGIVTEAWSPLGQGHALAHPVIAELAARHNRTPAQVVLRWHLQLGNVVIPKSTTPSRIRENLAVFDFELTAAELAAISALDTGTRLGPDPDGLDTRPRPGFSSSAGGVDLAETVISGDALHTPASTSPTCRSGACIASATPQNQNRGDRRKGDPPTTRRSPTPVPATTVIDGIVVRQCTDHERALLPPIARRQLRLKIVPLSAGLSDRPRHSLREVVLDHAARRRRVRGLPRIGVDQPPVLVERRMGDPQQAFAHTGNLVSHHEAAGRELGGHARRHPLRRSSTALGPGWFRPGGLVSPIGRVGSA